MDFGLLSTFIAYSVFILGVGVWGYRKKSFESYAVADRTMGLGLATTAFVATFLGIRVDQRLVGSRIHVLRLRTRLDPPSRGLGPPAPGSPHDRARVPGGAL